MQHLYKNYSLPFEYVVYLSISEKGLPNMLIANTVKQFSVRTDNALDYDFVYDSNDDCCKNSERMMEQIKTHVSNCLDTVKTPFLNNIRVFNLGSY